MYGHFEVVKALVSAGADVALENINKKTAQMLASKPIIRDYLKTASTSLMVKKPGAIVKFEASRWRDLVIASRSRNCAIEK